MSDYSDEDRTASLMTPAKLAQLKVRPQAAASPGAWLDQMAADAGSGHVRRLLDLRRQLELQLHALDPAAAGQAAQALHDALGQLDFSLLQPRGWLARAAGKGKEAGAAFVAQYERIGRAADDLSDEARDLQRKQQAQATATGKILLECASEIRAIEKIMDQGARWLQDMRNQLKLRRAEGGGDEQVRADNARCELLVTRLKLLRSADTAAQQAAERCQSATSRRATVLAAVQQLLAGEWKAAREQLSALANQARHGAPAEDAVDAARGIHQQVRSALQQLTQDLAAVQAADQAAADELAALLPPLQAAA